MIKVNEKVLHPDQWVINWNRFEDKAHEYSKVKVHKTFKLTKQVSLSVSVVQEQIITIDTGGVDEKE